MWRQHAKMTYNSNFLIYVCFPPLDWVFLFFCHIKMISMSIGIRFLRGLFFVYFACPLSLPFHVASWAFTKGQIHKRHWWRRAFYDYWSPTIHLNSIVHFISYIIFHVNHNFIMCNVFWIDSKYQCDKKSYTIHDFVLYRESYLPNRTKQCSFYVVADVIDVVVVYDIKLDWSINKSHIINKTSILNRVFFCSSFMECNHNACWWGYFFGKMPTEQCAAVVVAFCINFMI